jgi:hypothetical protein
MFALVKNDNSIKLFSPYTIWQDKNGTEYSPDYLISLTSDQKQDLGIYDVAYANRPDDRFYTITQNEPTFDQAEKIVKVTYTSVAKDLENSELKKEWIASVKQMANNTLAQTDWMLVRKIERNVDVPAKTVTYRAAVIAEANRLTAGITAATEITELISLVTSMSWPSAE